MGGLEDAEEAYRKRQDKEIHEKGSKALIPTIHDRETERTYLKFLSNNVTRNIGALDTIYFRVIEEP
jgi:hypothetical protein